MRSSKLLKGSVAGHLVLELISGKLIVCMYTTFFIFFLYRNRGKKVGQHWHENGFEGKAVETLAGP